MTAKFTYKSYTPLLLPICLIISIFCFTKTAIFNASPPIFGTGVLLDLVISIPLLYFIIIRKTKIPNFTTIHIFLLGLFIAEWILPIEQQIIAQTIKSITLPAIKVAIIGLIIYKTWALKKSLNTRKPNLDFYNRLQIAVESVFNGRLGHIIMGEISVFYYLFIGKQTKDPSIYEFTYFKKNGIKTMLFGFIFLIIIETVVLHIIIGLWNQNIAWLLTIISIYTICQVIAIIRSMNHRLIRINHDKKQLELKYGFASQTIIPSDRAITYVKRI